MWAGVAYSEHCVGGRCCSRRIHFACRFFTFHAGSCSPLPQLRCAGVCAGSGCVNSHKLRSKPTWYIVNSTNRPNFCQTELISLPLLQIAFTVRWSKHVSCGLCLWTFTIFVCDPVADFKLHWFPEFAIRDSFSVFAPFLTSVSHLLVSYNTLVHVRTDLVCMLYHEYYVKWMAVRLGTFLVQLFNKKWNCWTIKFHS